MDGWQSKVNDGHNLQRWEMTKSLQHIFEDLRSALGEMKATLDGLEARVAAHQNHDPLTDVVPANEIEGSSHRED